MHAVSTTVRFSDNTHPRLTALAAATGRRMQTIVEDAVAGYEANEFWVTFAAGYDGLADDPAAWLQVQSERTGEETALADYVEPRFAPNLLPDPAILRCAGAAGGARPAAGRDGRCAAVAVRYDGRAGQGQRRRLRRYLGGSGVHRRRAVAGRPGRGPGPVQGSDQLLDARAARHPIRAQQHDVPGAGADLRLPRVHAAPDRLELQRGQRPLQRAGAGFLPARTGACAGAGRQAGPLRLRPRYAGAARHRHRRHPARLHRRLRRLPGDARRRRGPGGGPRRAAGGDVLGDVRDLQRSLADGLFESAHPAGGLAVSVVPLIT